MENNVSKGFGLGCGLVLGVVVCLFVILIVGVGGCTASTAKSLAEHAEKIRVENRNNSRVASSPEFEGDAPVDVPDKKLTIIEVSLKDKAMGKVNDFQEGLFWDIEYKAVGLEKDARAIKGKLLFYDLFGEFQFALKSSLTEGLKVGGTFVEKDTGFEYNQFMASHRWMHDTALKDMRVSYEVEKIIYVEEGNSQ